MAEGVGQIVTAGALMGRRYMCSKYYYDAVEEGCAADILANDQGSGVIIHQREGAANQA